MQEELFTDTSNEATTEEAAPPPWDEPKPGHFAQIEMKEAAYYVLFNEACDLLRKVTAVLNSKTYVNVDDEQLLCDACEFLRQNSVV